MTETGPALPRTMQGRVVMLLVVAAAATRLVAISASPWDWDEMLFSQAVRDYDAASQRPHPPGFPLFVLAGKALHALGLTEFRALQTVSVAAAMLLLPAALFFFRAAGSGLSTGRGAAPEPDATNPGGMCSSPAALGASVILVFFPNVWFFGGASFSDVPSLTLGLFAAGLLLQGRTSSPSFYGGAIVLALAAAVRPQNLLVGMVPALAAVRARWKASGRRSFGASLAAISIGGAMLLAFYGWAVAESGGWGRYADALSRHEAYIRTTDSFLSETRRPLHRILDDFFVRPFRAPSINILVSVAAAVGAIAAVRRRDRGMLLVAGAFAPFALFAWLFLDHFSASRFSIGYAPLVAALAASGIEAMTSMLPVRMRIPARAVMVGGLALTMVIWTWPALSLVRSRRSPTMASMEWIRANVPRGATIYVHETMVAFAAHELPGYRRVATRHLVPPEPLPPGNAWIVAEGLLPDGVGFSWPKARLHSIARERYFDVSVAPVPRSVEFRDGWYDTEWDESSTWRWMRSRAVAVLAPREGRPQLRLHVMPPEGLPRDSMVTIVLDGDLLDRFAIGSGGVERSYPIPAAPGSRMLVIETDQVKHPAGSETRELGLRVEEISWR